MRRSGLVVFAWLVALMLVMSPVLPAGMSQGASAETETELPGGELPPADGTPTGEPSTDPTATETATEPSPSETPTAEPTTDPSATPEDPVTETATEPVTEEPSATETTEATSTSTPEETPEEDLFSAAALSDIVITLKCTTDPESIRVTNTGGGNITLTSIGTIKDLVGSEPWPLNRVLKPGGTAIFQAGHAAQYGTVLTNNFILTNSAYDEEGV